jgi:hypothetical protein
VSADDRPLVTCPRNPENVLSRISQASESAQMTSAIALAAIAAFNLVCTGTHTSGVILGQKTPDKPMQTVVRVDLDAKRWCSGDCESTSAISDVTATAIIFNHREDKYGDETFIVNRETGKFTDRTRIWWPAERIDLTQGTCVKADFSGFPNRKF